LNDEVVEEESEEIPETLDLAFYKKPNFTFRVELDLSRLPRAKPDFVLTDEDFDSDSEAEE
jgi:hypothetical protein